MELANSTQPSSKKIDWVKSIPFIVFHIAALGVFLFPFSWKLVGLCVGLYYIRMFAITAGYHRYFSHRSYKLGRVSQFLMASLGSSSLQKGVLWWAAHHRMHHRFSDQPNDLHSPIQSGFWYSHLGWILSNANDETRFDQVQDLAKFRELRWINRYHVIPGILLAVMIFALGGAAALFWGFFLSTVLLWHGTFTINSLSHVFGSRRYVTTDTSKNNFFLALVTLGEGWHNNHHCYMSSANQGFYWWEIDGSYYVLKALSWMGVARDLRRPPLALLEAKRLDQGARDQMPSRARLRVLETAELRLSSQ